MDLDDVIQRELSQIEKIEEISMNINLFKQYLSGKVELGENIGVVANYLEEPRNQEEQMLMELWKSGSIEEQKKLAHTLLELVRKA